MLFALTLACEGPDSGSGFGATDPESPGGLLDTSYGQDGVVELPVDEYRNAYVGDMTVLPDGCTLAVGNMQNPDDPTLTVPMVLRVDESGAVDLTFAGGVRLQGADSGSLRSVIADTEGQIWMSGAGTLSAPSWSGAFVLRLRPDGTPDPDWGDGGYAGPIVGDSADSVVYAPLLLVDPDGGAVVIVGPAQDRLVAVRFDPDGLLDPSFADGAGELLISAQPYGAFAQAASAASDEVFVVTNDSRVVAFGWSGTDLRELGRTADRVTDIAVDDSNVWLGVSAGASLTPSPVGRAQLERWSTDEEPASDWGAAGLWDSGDAASSAGPLWLYDDGRVLVSGSRNHSFQVAPTLWRVDGAGQSDLSFGVGGEVELPFFNGSGWGPAATAVKPDGRIVVAVGGYKTYFARLLP